MQRRTKERVEIGAGVSVGIILATALGDWLLSDRPREIIEAIVRAVPG